MIGDRSMNVFVDRICVSFPLSFHLVHDNRDDDKDETAEEEFTGKTNTYTCVEVVKIKVPRNIEEAAGRKNNPSILLYMYKF
uniref:Uncharacterized protein n=1 Tax=Onchocerca volvulus TaxID=6282 RepID=A0A8R1TKQ0_ONCVO